MHSPKQSAQPLSKPVMKRYWPGKAPVYAKEDEDTFDLYDDPERPKQTLPPVPGAFAIKTDPRLQRLEEVQEQTEGRRRKYQAAEVIESEPAATTPKPTHAPLVKKEEDDEAEEVVAARRERARARAQQVEEEEVMKVEEEEEEEENQDNEEGSSSSEFESDSDEQAPVEPQKRFKPVFVVKAERETIAEKERLEQLELARLEKEREEMLERKKESHDMLIETIKQDLEGNDADRNVSDVEMPDTDDDADAEKEYAAWKLRELKRIKREQDERERIQKERDEIEERRNMTEAEKLAEDKRLGKLKPKEKHKMKFLQKYYHRGAFYQDTDDVSALMKQDFNQPTLEDKFDKEALPTVKQVKNFGRAGRTKWTHLVDQDTTEVAALKSARQDPLREKYFSKMAGVNRPLARPKGHK
eukprot:c5020_g1_i1.p1 GENE.c5020_g1_i1~~c5020_g1_i1.p1  ORF type:complete len:430 (-),score=109.91 c5020_g1_i1:20-1261(-)